MWHAEAEKEQSQRRRKGGWRKKKGGRKDREIGGRKTEDFGGRGGAAAGFAGRVRSGCTRVRMHVALRWRNSFHATRVPDHISSENHSGPGSVSTVGRGIKSSSAPKSRATARRLALNRLVPNADRDHADELSSYGREAVVG